MDLGEKGLQLSNQEAFELARVFYVVKHLSPIRARGPLLVEANVDERSEATALAAELLRLYRSTNPEEIVVEQDRFPAVLKYGELAMANTHAVMVDLCTPSLPDGFHSGLRPGAFTALATTATAIEKVRPFVPAETEIA